MNVFYLFHDPQKKYRYNPHKISPTISAPPPPPSFEALEQATVEPDGPTLATLTLWRNGAATAHITPLNHTRLSCSSRTPRDGQPQPWQRFEGLTRFEEIHLRRTQLHFKRSEEHLGRWIMWLDPHHMLLKLNHKTIHSPTHIQHGDRISINHIEFIFELTA